ncbi:MAG: hypothetical protein HY906_07340 [Deltaproteobacteria bacterium]|nr:hypothetical protein [Deltaproteobacteria bacterium]
MQTFPRPQLIVVLVAVVLGLAFAGLSSYDSMQHLDRQLHEVHCSFVPGLAGAAGDNPCRTAMYSSYSALLRGAFWGGIPISLLALGVYAFFGAFAVALLVGGEGSSRRAFQFLGVASLGPVIASILMAVISAARLGTFCRTCVGLYVASILLAVGALWAMRRARGAADAAGAGFDAAVTSRWRTTPASPAVVLAWLGALGACVLLPAVVYVAALPDYGGRLEKCGKLPEPTDTSKALVKLQTAHPRRAMTLFVDPLCPTCKALHQRLDAEGAVENLDLRIALLPLDSDCNWMVDRSLHQGSCVLSRALICNEARAREALEWMYAQQEELTRLGKAGEGQLKARLRERFGADLATCLDARKTRVRLNNLLQYAVTNHVPVSTPQMYLGERRVCDEDTDLGLRYTLGRLAPEVLR